MDNPRSMIDEMIDARVVCNGRDNELHTFGIISVSINFGILMYERYKSLRACYSTKQMFSYCIYYTGFR